VCAPIFRIRVDANSTSSVEDINKWTEAVRHQYHNVDYAIFKGWLILHRPNDVFIQYIRKQAVDVACANTSCTTQQHYYAGVYIIYCVFLM